jgi:hypothetical protein
VYNLYTRTAAQVYILQIISVFCEAKLDGQVFTSITASTTYYELESALLASM